MENFKFSKDPHFVEKLRHSNKRAFEDDGRTVEAITTLCDEKLITPVEKRSKYPIAITAKGLGLIKSIYSL